MRRIDLHLCAHNRANLYREGFRFAVATLNSQRIVGAYFTYSQALRAMKRRQRVRRGQYATFALYAWES